jgi:hypothetical protein
VLEPGMCACAVSAGVRMVVCVLEGLGGWYACIQ